MKISKRCIELPYRDTITKSKIDIFKTDLNTISQFIYDKFITNKEESIKIYLKELFNDNLFDCLNDYYKQMLYDIKDKVINCYITLECDYTSNKDYSRFECNKIFDYYDIEENYIINPKKNISILNDYSIFIAKYNYNMVVNQLGILTSDMLSSTCFSSSLYDIIKFLLCLSKTYKMKDYKLIDWNCFDKISEPYILKLLDIYTTKECTKYTRDFINDVFSDVFFNTKKVEFDIKIIRDFLVDVWSDKLFQYQTNDSEQDPFKQWKYDMLLYWVQNKFYKKHFNTIFNNNSSKLENKIITESELVVNSPPSKLVEYIYNKFLDMKENKQSLFKFETKDIAKYNMLDGWDEVNKQYLLNRKQYLNSCFMELLIDSEVDKQFLGKLEFSLSCKEYIKDKVVVLNNCNYVNNIKYKFGSEYIKNNKITDYQRLLHKINSYLNVIKDLGLFRINIKYVNDDKVLKEIIQKEVTRLMIIIFSLLETNTYHSKIIAEQFNLQIN